LKNKDGRPEIHYTRIYRAFRRFEAHGCFDAIFAGSVSQLHQKEYLDISVIHGDGTTTAAKKGGSHLGFSGHKHMKGDKVVAFCDPNCNVRAPFVAALKKLRAFRSREPMPKIRRNPQQHNLLTHPQIT